MRVAAVRKCNPDVSARFAPVVSHVLVWRHVRQHRGRLALARQTGLSRHRKILAALGQLCNTPDRADGIAQLREDGPAGRLLQRIVVMSAIIAAVRQIARGLGRRAEERFCLIYELRLADTNGFAFLPSAELTENDAVDTLTAAGYDLREALRLIMDARLLFKSR